MDNGQFSYWNYRTDVQTDMQQKLSNIEVKIIPCI
jgi:hypothetical protein